MPQPRLVTRRGRLTRSPGGTVSGRRIPGPLGINGRLTGVTSVLLKLGIRAQAQAPAAAPRLSPDLHVGYFCTSVFHVSHLYTQAQLVIYFLCCSLRVFFSTFPPSQVHSLKLALEGVEKERDFYFGKLREIELLCQEHGQENDDLVQRLMEVLYASEEHVSVSRALRLVSQSDALGPSAVALSLQILPWDLSEACSSASACDVPRGINTIVVIH